MKLIAVNKLEDGSRDGIAPGEIFDLNDKEEAKRLISIGAAKLAEEKLAAAVEEKPAKKGKKRSQFELPEA